MSWDQKLFHRHLKTRRFGRELVYLAEVDSTNRRLAENHAQFTISGGVVVAGHQTAGRGRQSRTWLDQSENSLLFSLLLRNRAGSAELSFLSLLPAIALGELLHEKFGATSSVRLKWPNDVLMNDRKLAGVLGQALTSDGVLISILGMGVNVRGSQEDFPPELRSAATTIEAETGVLLAREVLLAELLNRLEELHDLALENEIEVLRLRWMRLGPPVGAKLNRIEGGLVLRGEFAGLGERGQLLLRTKDNVIQGIFSGDIES